MSFQSAAAVTVLKTLNLVLGGLITFYAYRAYERTDSSPLFALFVGFGIITVGAVVAGIGDQLLGVDPGVALVVEGVFTTVGFATILYSLHM